jgi:molybdate transport system regulatory protein
MTKPKPRSSGSPETAETSGTLAPFPVQVVPRIRVLCGTEIALGPGKIALLSQIAKTGSLTEAARSLSMSYMRAWKLTQTMNACFVEPVVVTQRGGSTHGGAEVTETGLAVLRSYESMERSSLHAMDYAWKELRRLLRDPRGGKRSTPRR